MRSPKTLKLNHLRKLKQQRRQGGDIYLALVPQFLEMINTVKLFHWRTTSFSIHKATDELFSALNGKVDSFVEVLLGKAVRGRDALLQVGGLTLRTCKSVEEFKPIVQNYIQFLLSLSQQPTFNTLANTDLLNMRDEMVGLLNQFLYLLTLS
jgi:hypothetical protein